VVGAGVAGLRCAQVLAEAGVDVVLLERENRVGGRVKTDRKEGFLLDRGFQVLPTAYREARACLDFEDLTLHRFRSGALVRLGGSFHALHAPLRHPGRIIETARSHVGSPGDGIRLGLWVARLLVRRAGAVWTAPEQTSAARLGRLGFSERIVESFFRPFFGGVFLERDLETSSRMLEFVLRTFASGPAALPATGMEAIPRQMVSGLPDGAVHTGVDVAAVDSGGRGVVTREGQRIDADAVVVAADPWTASRLLPAIEAPVRRSVAGLYFEADAPPLDEPLLVLNGEGTGPVNHLSVQSRVCSRYAPPGRELISVTVLREPPGSDDELEGRVRRQLRGWFGEEVRRWRLLRVDRLPAALPGTAPHEGGAERRRVRLGRGLYVCGDHREHPSLEGALVSGRRAAAAALEDL